MDSYLSHPHLWVQLAASQLFGLLFAAWQPEKLLPDQSESGTQYLAVDTRKKVNILITSFLVENLLALIILYILSSRVLLNMILLCIFAYIYCF